MPKALKEIFVELASFSTSYGAPKLIRSKRCYQKLLWIFFILLSAIFSFLIVYEAILNYSDFKVITLVESIYKSPLEFPVVSICSYSGDHFKGKNLSSIFKKCSFAYDTSCGTNHDNFFEKFIGNNGYECYRFNSGKNLSNHSVPVVNSTIGGVDDSFSIQIDKEKDMQIWVHNINYRHNFVHFNNHYEDRVFVSANSYTEVIIHKVIEVKLGEPYNDCLNDITQFKYNKTIIDFIRKINDSYSQEKCFEWCFELNYLKEKPCNCTNVQLGEVWQKCYVSVSSNLKSSKNVNCIWDYKSNFYSRHIVDECTQYCPLECTSISYNIRSNAIMDFNHTKLKVYYGNLKYTSIKQEAKTSEIELISNIGGTFGLLAGFSFVTFFEIFEFLIELMINIFPKKKCNKKSLIGFLK